MKRHQATADLLRKYNLRIESRLRIHWKGQDIGSPGIQEGIRPAFSIEPSYLKSLPPPKKKNHFNGHE